MRYLVVADLHIGAGAALGEAGDRLGEQADYLGQVRSIAQRERVDAILVAGDVFHHRRPSPAEYMAWLDAEWGAVPVRIIAGNHDVNALRASAIDPLQSHSVHVHTQPGVEQDAYADAHVLGGRIAYLPWTSLSELRRDDWTDGKEYASAAALLLDVAAGLRTMCEDDAVLVLHWSVQGATLPNGTPVTDLREPIIPLQPLVEQGWRAIVCGHIHKRQFMHPRAFYPGSPWMVDWGESAEPHGVVLLDTEAQEATPIEVEDLFRTLTYDMLTGEVSLPDVAGKRVRVRVRREARQEAPLLEELEALVGDAGGTLWAVTHDVHYEHRSRAAQLTEARDIVPAMQDYLDATPDIPPAHHDEILSAHTFLTTTGGDS